MKEFTLEEKKEYFLGKLKQKIDEHQSKHQNFDGERLLDWIVDKTKDKALNKQVWSYRYYLHQGISYTNKMRKSEASINRMTLN